MRNNDALTLMEYIYNLNCSRMKKDKYIPGADVVEEIKVAIDMIYDREEQEIELSQGEIDQFLDFLNEVRG